MFFIAIEAIYEEKEENIRNMAVANRMAYYANEDEFREFIRAKEEVNLDEIDEFSL